MHKYHSSTARRESYIEVDIRQLRYYFAIGAYSSGIMTKVFKISTWWGLLIGIAAAVLRLKDVYVILVTFAFGQFIKRRHTNTKAN